MDTRIDNQQGINLEQIQVILSGILGDGAIIEYAHSSSFCTNCIHLEYIEYKKKLLSNLVTRPIYSHLNGGYKQNLIHRLDTIGLPIITSLNKLSIEDKLSQLTDLGVALWFYDDGALHYKNGFYNLNTHSFSEEVNREIFVPFFRNLGMKPDVYFDKKKDGRVFSYLYFGKHFGAFEINKILSKYPIDCYSYKLWPSETIQKWSKLQMQLKSENKVVTPRKFSNLLEKTTL